MKNLFNISLLLVIFVINLNSTLLEQSRTFSAPILLVPPSSTARQQLIWGVGVPNQIGYESVLWGVTLKSVYYLPTTGINTFNTDSLKPVDWPGLGVIENKRKKREITQSEKSLTRWMLYEIFEQFLKENSYGDKECILRSICEAAQVPFNYKSGILGEILHILFTPSSSPDTLSKHSDNEYLFAEKMGEKHERCDLLFRECNESLLEIFSGVYDPLFYKHYDD
uniref:CSON000718 protein n=1 Tax=Culicoides sonorensis TaxID=179676 RepID=A0A336MF10_CULSO